MRRNRRPRPGRCAQRRLFAASLGALLLLAATLPAAFAEVSVILDDKGRYIKFFSSYAEDINPETPWSRIYSSRILLNEYGDVYGDLPPAHALLAHENNAPFVVWPYRTNSGDYDLAYSSFDTQRLVWSPTTLLNPAPNATQEIHPMLAYGPDTAVHLAYESVGMLSAVYYSRYKDGEWSVPFRLSSPQCFATVKSISVVGDRVHVEVEERQLVRSGPVFRTSKIIVKTYIIPTSPPTGRSRP